MIILGTGFDPQETKSGSFLYGRSHIPKKNQHKFKLVYYSGLCYEFSVSCHECKQSVKEINFKVNK